MKQENQEVLDLFIQLLNKDNNFHKKNGNAYSENFKNGLHTILDLAKKDENPEFFKGMSQAILLMTQAKEFIDKNRNEKPKNKYLLIDGNGVLVSSFFGTAPKEIYKEKDPQALTQIYTQLLQNEDGVHINGLVSMVKKILDLIKYQKPTHIFIGFDKNRNTFRKEKYPLYKAQRTAAPFPLKEQIALAPELFRQLGISAYDLEGYEADDLIGSMVKKIKREDPTGEIFLYSKDKDWLQLVEDNVYLYLCQQSWEKAEELMTKLYPDKSTRPIDVPKGTVLINKKTCFDFVGVNPNQIADWKGIAGDPSDNIPGVKGVAAPSLPLLKEYGTLENIYKAIDACNEDPIKLKELSDFWKVNLGIKRNPLKLMIKGKELGLLSKELATIYTDLDIQDSLDNYSIDTINEDDLKKTLSETGILPFLYEENEINQERT